ncbi:Phox homologous domain-containing protein [Chaetomium sp. MPI-SDFR-AT-0129]|nr:Phox homologous domain-containing protein [Chaetomium sp. MPI-SDFR-AT-0129]
MAPPLEISIPTTSLHTPDDNSKPYTLYNITLRLPLRSFVVQKRYSDFATLHQSLTSLVGAPPPAPLPAKQWFRSTVSSPDLTEQRRAGLERYMRAIAEPPDRRWRDTPVWRGFLNLPSSAVGGSARSASGVNVEARVPAIGLRDATLAAASDPATWVDLNKEMKAELSAARAALARREHTVGEKEGREAESQARRALIKAGSLLKPLEEGLKVMKESGRLGGGEFTRRRDAVEAAKYEKGLLDQLASALVTRGAASAAVAASGASADSDRAKLLGTARRPVGRTIGAPLPETEETRELDNEGVLERQKLVVQEQDERVNLLRSAVSKLNQLGTAIDDEVTYQNGLLDQANDAADNLQRKLGVANRRAKNL